MLAGFENFSPLRAGCSLLIALCLASPLALARSPGLDARLAETGEFARFAPDKALPMLLGLEQEASTAAPITKAEFKSQLSMARIGLGQKKEALALAEEIIVLGKEQRDNRVIAKGLLAKAYLTHAVGEVKQSHLLAREGEQAANATSDLELRAMAAIASGQSYAEEGNYPVAVARLQAATVLAREQGQPLGIVISLHGLSNLYCQMRKFDKCSEVLAEAAQMAAKINSPGRMAKMKMIESGLLLGTNQPQRGLQALLEARALERKIGATPDSLLDLSDNYLKQRDYPKVLAYANEALEAAKRLNNQDSEAIAHVNIGQAYIGMGRLAEGKRNFAAGVAHFESAGDKPQMQAAMLEYGEALERAGDASGAIAAYHRERELSNELFEAQSQKTIWELQEKYTGESKQRQIELLRRENQVKSVEIDNRRLQQRVWWLLAVLFALASVVVGLLYRKVRQSNTQLEIKNLELKQLSSRDPLTTLYNRRHFQEFMRLHLPVEKRTAGVPGEGTMGALFLLDVDNFKHVNDRHGHAAGDAVLKMMGEKLRLILRETDMIVRWGGEEFLTFLPAVPHNGIEEIARRLLAGISAHTIDYQGSKISVNVSIGFAPFPLRRGGHPLPWERVVNLIDMALYLAKTHGRNRAYGVLGFANEDQASMEIIEQDLERAWRAGFVDLAIVLGAETAPASGEARAAVTVVNDSLA